MSSPKCSQSLSASSTLNLPGLLNLFLVVGYDQPKAREIEALVCLGSLEFISISMTFLRLYREFIY